MSTIMRLDALEILDSRGRPTLKVTCELEGGVKASASVPAGASTGRAEALELRDGDARRYAGLGCLKAVAKVRGIITDTIGGQFFPDQDSLDAALIRLDGTPDMARLGANSVLGVSVAFARASAVERGEPLYIAFADMAKVATSRLPRPTINLFSGGRHAGGQMSIQDVLVIPLADTIDECLAQAFDVYQAAATWSSRTYGTRMLRADEGGLAPPFTSSEEAIAGAVTAIEAAGLRPGKDVALALDVAASHFFREGRYHLDEEVLSPDELIARVNLWTESYPIVSVEDGLDEDDWDNWSSLMEVLPDQTLVLGDDLLCTRPERIERAVSLGAANALLLKVNQVGTITEAVRALKVAQVAGWHVTVSARSGETEDDWLADLAVGWGSSHIKIGSITQSERLAKYNRLLEIERESGWELHPVPEKPSGSKER